jgi:hypothetical protein
MNQQLVNIILMPTVRDNEETAISILDSQQCRSELYIQRELTSAGFKYSEQWLSQLNTKTAGFEYDIHLTVADRHLYIVNEQQLF